jgi:hypothetical protein
VSRRRLLLFCSPLISRRAGPHSPCGPDLI